MFCKPCLKSLTVAAASGEQLPHALQQHLGTCESCHAAFAEEQRLFAAIEVGLRSAANAEVPVTLIPRVHVALTNELLPLKPNRIWFFAAAPLLAAAVLALIYLPSRGSRGPAQITHNASNRAASTTTTAATPSIVNNERPRGVSKVRHDGRTTLIHRRNADANLVEVIVEPEEAAALLRYEARLRGWSTPKSRTLLARTIELRPGIEPLEIVELEVGDLTIPALAKAEADK
jgi:hypothetical protein